MDWQTPAAIGVVLLALFLLIRGARKKNNCGGSCGCGKDDSQEKSV
ncbi:hypothetical protein N9F48_00130 [Akkermansiaceae bacterium]|nr:hypothetical protein [bacterium]MDA7629400.1 hypothetical protein [Akkermansiaceae bacterium]MDA8968455.1 hypothetical protein [Akkermansiaceae bacterium]MDB4041471.1 hypothetical protein [Akkermansiaceae bacterium]MDB4332174.1 hypothetical protein [Akkermansiaceae bacterium]